VNTLKPMTVVTQFLTTDGTDAGDLSEIRRFYVQDGKIIHGPSSTILGVDDTDSITDGFCDAKKDLFGDVKDFQELGGMKGMGESLDRGHVMIFSLWDDVEVNMLWLDSSYPLDKPKTDPGITRGDCPGGVESTPTYVRENFPNGYVTFKNAAVGEIGSTLLPPDPNAPTPSPVAAPCGCESADGTNQPECGGNSMSKCKQMIDYEGKCKWTECIQPTPPPTPTSPAPTPTPPPTGGCYSNNYKDCLPEGYTSSNTSCDTVWLPNGPQKNCVALWGDCTGSASTCCGPAECFSGTSNSVCVPPTTVTPAPTSPPTNIETVSPSKSCSVKGEACQKNKDCCKNKCMKKKKKCKK